MMTNSHKKRRSTTRAMYCQSSVIWNTNGRNASCNMQAQLYSVAHDCKPVLVWGCTLGLDTTLSKRLLNRPCPASSTARRRRSRHLWLTSGWEGGSGRAGPSLGASGAALYSHIWNKHAKKEKSRGMDFKGAHYPNIFALDLNDKLYILVYLITFLW